MIASDHNLQRLSIRLTPNGFSFCVTTLSDFRIEQFHQIGYFSDVISKQELLFQALEEQGFLEHPITDIRIIFDTYVNTLIPSDLYRDEPDTFLRFNYGQEHMLQTQSLATPIAQTGIYHLFAADSSLYCFLNRSFVSALFTCSAEAVLRWILFYHLPQENTLIFYPTQNHLYFFYFAEGILQLHNTFKASTPAEGAYYILSIHKELSCEQEPATQILGISKDNPLLSLLEQYIDPIEITSLPDPMWESSPYSIPFDQYIVHQL